MNTQLLVILSTKSLIVDSAPSSPEPDGWRNAFHKITMEKGKLEEILELSCLLALGAKAAAKIGHAIVRITFYFQK